MILQSIHDLITDMEVKYQDLAEWRQHAKVNSTNQTADVEHWFANNAQELIRDIYANIILLDAHYSSVVREQIDEGHYDYLLKDHWVQEIQWWLQYIKSGNELLTDGVEEE